MKPLDRIAEICSSVAVLLQEIKDGGDSMTLVESHRLYSAIRETEGWLKSCRAALEPEGTSPTIR